MKNIITLLGFLILLISCLDEENTYPINTDNILQIELSQDTLVLGIDSLIFIDFCVDEKYTDKSIKIVVKGGRIDGNENIHLHFKGQTCLTKTFTPSNKTGVFDITATFNEDSDITKTVSVIIQNPIETDILNLVIDKEEIHINRVEEIPIKILLKEDYNNRNVIMTLENINLLGYPDGSATSITIPKNGFNGILKIKPEANEGYHRITVKTEDNLLSTEKLLKYIYDPIDSVLKFNNISSGNILANDFDEYELEIELNNFHSEQLEVSTNYGTFQNGLKTMDLNMDSPKRIIGLKTSDSIIPSAMVTLKTKDSNYLRTIYLSPLISEANYMETYPSSWNIDSSLTPSNSLTITGQLSCNSGKVTKGRIISAIAYQEFNGNIEYFGNFGTLPLAQSGDNGTFQFTYIHTPHANKELPLFIVVSAPSTTGNISDTIQIQVD